MGTSFSFPQVSKVSDTLAEQGITPELLQAVLLGQGVLSDVAQAVVAGTVPARDEFRRLLGLASVVSLPKKPLPFPKNANGHFVVTLTGASRLGMEDSSYLEGLGFVLSDDAKLVLGSTGPDSYDVKHRLAEGQICQVALVPGRDYKALGKRCATQDLQAYGQSFGYGKALAGMMPRVREVVSDEQMEEMGFYYLAGLHDAIKVRGDLRVLDSRRHGNGRCLSTLWVSPNFEWFDVGAFVFPISALSPLAA